MWSVFDFIKRFLYDLYKATIFAAIEYDQHLQSSKTTSQRLFIWFIILCIVAGVCLLILFGVWSALDAIPDVTL